MGGFCRQQSGANRAAMTTALICMWLRHAALAFVLLFPPLGGCHPARGTPGRAGERRRHELPGWQHTAKGLPAQSPRGRGQQPDRARPRPRRRPAGWPLGGCWLALVRPRARSGRRRVANGRPRRENRLASFAAPAGHR
jgi:hypothetical protein